MRDFAQACEDAGLVFIGPSARSIRADGLEDGGAADRDAGGAPVVPGTEDGFAPAPRPRVRRTPDFP